MAAIVGRASREALLKVSSTAQSQNVRQFSFQKLSKAKKAALGTAGVLATGGVGFAVALNTAVLADDEFVVHPPKQPWSFGILSGYDHHSLRRGYEVYKQVCAACHSLQYIRYRELVGVIFSKDEAKAEAAESTVVDGPNGEGEMFERPGKLTDVLPSPYPNPEAAAAANNGAKPPDLTFITRARHGGADYIYSLLTGYKEAPAGVELADGQHYNPYFPGGKISMAEALYNEIIEYQDGTPASQSQLAKDVVTFLQWCAEPEADTRKRYWIKYMIISSFFVRGLYYVTKFFRRH
ncbi:cytochrome c1, heme protein, mitochondrial-like isoform X2 [Mya arenaria]|uniref:cytochrome c1, heme protein, mitochondrial-like isoform X2 n=1 Tax=Mya arenaria TaxID=6604 RepID=UPI0022E3614A|nr:cytochrome c1, heme protein, mitochondrial-like isoform X2 [Mya arenaria]